MNKVTIKELNISMFAGIGKMDIDFDSNYHTIQAENGSGKSTILKAINWLLDFNVQDFYPKKDNLEIKDITPSVTAIFNINNLDYTFNKQWHTQYVLNEQTQEMVKKSANAKYYIDGVELTKKSYDKRIGDLFGVDYDYLERLIDKEFFNTDTSKWKWTDRRKLVLEMCGVNNVNDMLFATNKYDDIKELIIKGNATSDIQSTLRKAKVGYKDKQKINLALIEQKQKEIMDIGVIDFDDIKNQIDKKQAKLDKLIVSSKKENMTEQLKNLQNDLFAKQKELSKLQILDSNGLSAKNNQKIKMYNDLLKILANINTNNTKYTNIKNNIIDKNFDMICPFCHQPLPQDQIDKIKEDIENKIKQQEVELKNLEETIKLDKADYADLKAKYDSLVKEISEHKRPQEIEDLQQAIEQLKTALNSMKQSSLNDLSKEEEITLKEQIKALTMQLANQDLINKGNNLIKMWQSENADLGDKIVAVELKERLLKEFVKEQCDIVEDTVNNYFGNGIKFALFEIVNNNGDPTIKENFEVLWNGKSYSAMSTGEKLFVNLRICEKLQEYYKCETFIFVDNAESITKKIESNRQLICLSAVKNAKLNAIKVEDLY